MLKGLKRINAVRKSNTIKILACVEVLLILIGIAGLFGKSQIVVSMNQTEQFLEEGVTLPAGAYTLKVFYEGGAEAPGRYSLHSDTAFFKSVLSNSVPLGEDCQFYLMNRTKNLKLVLDKAEDVSIVGAEVISSAGGSRIYLFWLLVILVPCDLILFFTEYCKSHFVPTDKKIVIFGLSVLGVAASLPTFVDYSIPGADMMFHLQRIEALAQSILHGELPARMGSFWLRGHGYASSYFYGDTLLAVPALLRVLGLDISTAYRVFLVFINILTIVIAYVSTSQCFKSRYIGLLGSVLYTMAPYRLYNLYQRAAIGEASAMIFLPLILWGMYRIYTEDTNRKGYFWNWVIPAIGFSGVIQSHLLSCEMVAVFVMLGCLLLWKKTFQRNVFAVLCCTAGITFLVNAWFLVPCLDMMLSGQYRYSWNAQNLIQHRGVYLAQIFYTLQAAGNSSPSGENGMLGAEPIGLGGALLLCAVLWFVFRYLYKKKDLHREERLWGDLLSGLLLLALFLSTRYFPYDFFSTHFPALASLIGALQFPTRFTAIASVLGVFLACVVGKRMFRENDWPVSGEKMLFLVMSLALVFGTYQLNDILRSREAPLRLYSAQNMGSISILGGEYLPTGVEFSHFDSAHGPVYPENVELTDYEKRGLAVEAGIQAEGSGWVEFPLLYYKGYRACVSGTGEGLTVQKGDNADVRVLLPEGFSGKIRVWYAEMWYWHLAEVISVLSGLGFLFYYFIEKYVGAKRGTAM